MSEETVSRGTNMKRILFYRVNEPYGELSNFAPFPFELKGKRWPTAEHYFQAQKFAGTDPSSWNFSLTCDETLAHKLNNTITGLCPIPINTPERP